MEQEHRQNGMGEKLGSTHLKRLSSVPELYEQSLEGVVEKLSDVFKISMSSCQIGNIPDPCMYHMILAWSRAILCVTKQFVVNSEIKKLLKWAIMFMSNIIFGILVVCLSSHEFVWPLV